MMKIKLKAALLALLTTAFVVGIGHCIITYPEYAAHVLMGVLCLCLVIIFYTIFCDFLK